MALALALSLAVPAESVRITDDPNGFNGYEWGKPSSKYPGLKLTQDRGGTDVFQKVEIFQNGSEPLSVNGVSFAEIRYRFVDDRLESIELTFDGAENRDKLMQWLEERYGKLVAAERKWRTIQWFGDLTTITLTYDRFTKQGSLWFICQRLNNLMNEHAAMPD